MCIAKQDTQQFVSKYCIALQQQTWYSVHHIVLPVRMPHYIVGVTITGTANTYAADSIHSYSVETKPAIDVHP